MNWPFIITLILLVITLLVLMFASLENSKLTDEVARLKGKYEKPKCKTRIAARAKFLPEVEDLSIEPPF